MCVGGGLSESSDCCLQVCVQLRVFAYMCVSSRVCVRLFLCVREGENVYACVCCERVNEREIMKNCVFVCVYMGMSKCKCA